MEEKIKQANPTLHRYLFTVTTFSKLLAMILFIVLPFVGFYLGMQYQNKLTTGPTPQEVQNALSNSGSKGFPSPTQTPAITHSAKFTPLATSLYKPDDYLGWLTYTSPQGDYSLKYPSEWKPTGPVGSAGYDKTNVYISKPPQPGFSEFSPYVWVIKVTNKNNSDFKTFITENFPDIKKYVEVADSQIGQYKVKEVAGLPSQMGSISVYFPIDNNSFINVSFTPYSVGDSNADLRIFEQILASFKLLQ
jgi:hypothetical protein